MFTSTKWLATSCVLGAMAIVSACASQGERPLEALATAEANIVQAEQSGAAQSSPLELDEARKKLQAARAASEQDENVEARRLAEQASADAEFATAQARYAEVQAAAVELDESNEVLRQETRR